MGRNFSKSATCCEFKTCELAVASEAFSVYQPSKVVPVGAVRSDAVGSVTFSTPLLLALVFCFLEVF